MNAVEILFGLLAAVAALAAFAGKIGVPYPIVLVLGGLALGFVPGLPEIQLPPDVVFLLFLPPLIYASAVFTPLRDLRENARAIGFLAIGVVLATMGVVAVVAHAAIPGFSWPAAFVLGAIAAASDAVATTAIGERLSISRRILTILEGESLVNDASSLVAYRIAVAAVVTGTFSLKEAVPQFLMVSAGGTAIGLVVGWVSLAARRRLTDPPVELTVSLLTPFAAYLAAESFGVSGILAVVSAGLFVEWLAPMVTPASTRIQLTAVWQTLVFLLNGVLFIYLGLQSRSILVQLSQWSALELLGFTALTFITVIVARAAGIWLLAHLPGPLHGRRLGGLGSRWKERAIIVWGGLRGVDSLAAALALPLATQTGARFPHRSLIIFLSFGVILASLVLQGLTLPWLIRWLRLPDDDSAEREEVTARLAAARAALNRLEELVTEHKVSPSLAKRLRAQYEDRAAHLDARLDGTDDSSSLDHLSAHQQVRRELLDAERNTVIDLRNRGVINDEVLRRVQADIDLEELRFAS
jgi:CPA1 family monovalent cation:H+ antiporter